MSRRNKRNTSNGGARLRIVSAAELMLIREQLEQVSRPGTDPLKQAAVLTWAMQYQGAYFHTRGGGLRRVFPKATEIVLFQGVPTSASGKALLSEFRSKGEEDATGQPQADALRD